MEQWRCVRPCFFRGKLYQVGEEVVGVSKDIPRHFWNKNTKKPGTFGQQEVAEKPVELDTFMGESPFLEKTKYLRHMNKLELCSLAKTLGTRFNPDEMTRAEMIVEIGKLKDSQAPTNQELVEATKGQ
jgi:hypothetical protein